MNRTLPILAVLALASSLRAEPSTETSWQKVQEAFAAAIETGHKSTVSIKVSLKKDKDYRRRGVENAMNARPMDPRANPNYYKRPKGSVSGVLADKDGHILTSLFNVDAVPEDIRKIDVTFPDGKQAKAQLLGTDEAKDLALLKIDPEGLDLHPVTWATDEPKVGSFVMALGRSPEPASGTATRGIVSAVDRLDWLYNQIWSHSIQFDAKTNYGNSGGALVNLKGEMVGIVCHVRQQSPWGQNSGIAFATPNRKIKEVWEKLAAGEHLRKPKLPFMGVSPREATVVKDGVELGVVQPGSAAAKAGLQVGDVIVKADDLDAKDWPTLSAYIRKHKPGDTLKLIVRRGEERMEMSVTLGERPN
jgi:S1-C subfamily serine protease